MWKINISEKETVDIWERIVLRGIYGGEEPVKNWNAYMIKKIMSRRLIWCADVAKVEEEAQN